MQLSKEEYARKKIHNGSLVQIENSVTRVSLVMPNSNPRDGIFNRHLTTIKDSYTRVRVCSEGKVVLQVSEKVTLPFYLRNSKAFI